ncbi:hypothetical protein BDW59DRAFT_180746 [Aspergillus cavernicola]|uniref:Zn(2)-C6 fungal-type domain-containing protein n=1 Tax=Aspergillus cavernicola TaxID=176166 RepID=A0ABR4I8I6_9EURO
MDQTPPPAPQQPTPNGDFPCAICNKTYSRRDLRDRHRRRCIKTIGQERRSKRKSCETCAQKKLRCSMARPACTRCLQIGLQCRYLTPRVPSQDTDGPSSTPSSSAPPATIQPSLLQVEHYDTSAAGSAPWTPFPSANLDPMADAFSATAFQNTDLMAPISWNEEFSISSHSLGQDEEILASISSHYSSDSPSSLFLPADEAHAAQSIRSDSLNNQSDVSMSSLSSNLGSSVDHAAGQSYRDCPHVDFNVDSSAQLAFGRNFVPKFGPLAPYDSEELYQQMFGVLREYPSLILQRDHWSPFIHHRMYRCSMGGMAKPMGVALACVSAHAGSLGSNHGFVDNLINKEREQLVREFQSYLDTQENCLAAVHAVCIYQVMGLFGDNFLPAAIKQSRDMRDMMDQRRTEVERHAELHSSFVLKMTRRLYKHYGDAIRTNHDDEMNWERWKFSESLRRNIFFANTINILGARAGKLNSAYFEPLDDDLILELPLPAPECMWRACSLREWLEAREYALRMVPATTAEEGKPRLTQTLQQLLQDEETGRLDVSGLLPLSRVVLASTKLSPKGYGL